MSERSGEIQRADPAAQRRAVIITVALAIMGALVIIVTERFIDNMVDRSGEDLRQATERLVTLLRVLAVAMGFVLSIMALWIARVALRAYGAGRFPPPDHKPARDTRVLSGARARRRALVSMGLALLLFLAGLASVVVVWRLVDSLSLI